MFFRAAEEAKALILNATQSLPLLLSASTERLSGTRRFAARYWRADQSMAIRTSIRSLPAWPDLATLDSTCIKRPIYLQMGLYQRFPHGRTGGYSGKIRNIYAVCKV